MDINVGGIDKILRVVIGLVLLSMLVWGEGNLRWWGLVGLIPLGTAVFGWCPLYTLVGISTCPLSGKKQS